MVDQRLDGRQAAAVVGTEGVGLGADRGNDHGQDNHHDFEAAVPAAPDRLQRCGVQTGSSAGFSGRLPSPHRSRVRRESGLANAVQNSVHNKARASMANNAKRR